MKLLNLKIKSTISNDVRAGVLLISHPLAAQHYKRSVILLLKHDENGSQGIIVNHRSEQLLPPAIGNLPSTLLQKNYTLNFGGTVARLNCVHNCEQLGGESIQNCTSPLFHGIDLSLITKLPYPCQNKTSKIHLFIGSCVWPPEELKNQIKKLVANGGTPDPEVRQISTIRFWQLIMGVGSIATPDNA